MEQPSIFSATLGLSPPWQVTSISFGTEMERMDIHIDLAHGCTLTCPTCGSEVNICSMESETWYHDDFFHYRTYLYAPVPHINCCDAIFPVARPWSRAGSRFVPLEGSCAQKAPRDQTDAMPSIP